jgi:hypothetical protein
LAEVSPEEKFRFDTLGVVSPAGYTVRKLALLDAVTVTFSTTATASAGTESMPATVRLSTLPFPTGFPVSLVSRIRWDASGT